jgi:hypothetical protein
MSARERERAAHTRQTHPPARDGCNNKNMSTRANSTEQPSPFPVLPPITHPPSQVYLSAERIAEIAAAAEVAPGEFAEVSDLDLDDLYAANKQRQGEGAGAREKALTLATIASQPAPTNKPSADEWSYRAPEAGGCTSSRIQLRPIARESRLVW